MARGKLLTDADRTAMRAAIAAGEQPDAIAKRMGRSRQTVKNFASSNGLKFDEAKKPKRGRKPKPAPPPTTPTTPTPAVPIPDNPVDKLHWLLDNACQRAAGAADTKEFGVAAKAAADTALAIHRLPPVVDDDDDVGLPDTAGALTARRA